VEAYKYDLKDAWDCLKAYERAMKERGLPIPTCKQSAAANVAAAGFGATTLPEDAHITHAWDLYYPIFKRINTQLPHVNALDLQSCSPSLFTAKDLDLGVPGTYTVNGNAVRIKSFHPIVSIIRSKQRPRKLRILGEDGLEFVFLLKGHEDLRQVNLLEQSQSDGCFIIFFLG
jgi:hypothetical protein